MSKVKVTMRMHADTKKRLRSIAQSAGISLSRVITHIIEGHLFIFQNLPRAEPKPPAPVTRNP